MGCVKLAHVLPPHSPPAAAKIIDAENRRHLNGVCVDRVSKAMNSQSSILIGFLFMRFDMFSRLRFYYASPMDWKLLAETLIQIELDWLETIEFHSNQKI